MALLLSRPRFLDPICVAVLSVVVALVGLKCGEYFKCSGTNMLDEDVRGTLFVTYCAPTWRGPLTHLL